MSVMGRILVGAALMAVLLAVGCSSGDSPSEITGPIATWTPAPTATSQTPSPSSEQDEPGESTSAVPFQLPSAAGGPVTLGSYLGEKNVALVFYRTYQ